MDKPIDELNISPRLLKALQSNHIQTLSQLERMDSIEILRMPNIGGKWYKELLMLLGRDLP